MANMTFGVNLIPSTTNTYTLGNSDKKWNLYVNQINGQAYTGGVSNLIITTTNATASDALTAATNTLLEGQLVFVFLNKAMSGSANATLQLGSASAINIYKAASTPLKGAFTQGSLLGFVYTSGALYMINPPVAI